MRRILLVLTGLAFLACSQAGQAPPAYLVVVPRIDRDFTPDGDPQKYPWNVLAPQVIFSQDWQGKQEYPAYRTEARLCWSDDYLYIFWEGHYQELGHAWGLKEYPNGETWGIWNGDVMEMFIGDNPDPKRYFEFVVSPRNRYIDLRHNKNLPRKKSYDPSWNSGWSHSTHVDKEGKRWQSEWRIPFSDIATQEIRPGKRFQGNFFRSARLQGEPLFLTWSPTMTSPFPAFHVPERFGEIELSPKTVESFTPNS